MKTAKLRCLLCWIILLIAGGLFACGGGGGNGSGGGSSGEDKNPPNESPNNQPPEANGDEVSTEANTPITFNPLDNDHDVDGYIDQSSFILLDYPVDTVTVDDDNNVTYTPPEKFVGKVELHYSVSDNDGASANATIIITVSQKKMSLIAQSGVRAVFYKDGVAFYNRGGGSGGGRGFNIAVFDSVTGELLEPPRNYDTWSGGSAKGAELADYIDHVVPVGAIVMLAVGDSAGTYGQELINALEDLGATQASNIGWRQTWAMIAKKGDDVYGEVRDNGQWQKINALADIMLDIEDPHGDTFNTATDIDPNNAVLGYLYKEEADVFRFELPHEGVFTLTCSKPDSTLVTLMDSLGQTIVTSLDYQQFTDKSIKYYLKSGVYYVEVRSSNDLSVGSFVLKAEYIIDPPLDVDLTFTALSYSGAQFAVDGEAFYTRAGGSGGGRGFNIAVVDPLTGDILDKGSNFDTWGQGETAGNALSVYIDGLANGSMLLLAVGDSAGTYGAGLTNTLKSLGATQVDGIGWRDTWAMIAIKGVGAFDEVRDNGEWVTVEAETTITVPGHDIVGEDFDEASTLEIESFTPSYLHENDIDVYSFTLIDPEIIRLESMGNVDTLVSLYVLNTSGVIELYLTEDQGGTADNFLVQENLPAGTYYIEITGHGIAPIGQYDLVVMEN